MLLPLLHLASCLALAGAAYRGAPKSAPLPFVIACAATSITAVFHPFAVEAFVAWYSGALYETAPPAAVDLARMAAFAALALLPCLGLIPGVRRRPRLVASLALCALAPCASGLVR